MALGIAVDLLHLSERRRRPLNDQEIYRTPAVVHVSRRLGTRRNEVEEAGEPLVCGAG